MGNVNSQKTPVPPRWNASQLPDTQGKIAVVTGAGTGIGYHTALELARRGAHVVVACHIEAQGLDAVATMKTELSKDTLSKPGRVEFMPLDVSSLASVESFAIAFKVKFSRLDILVLNAGIVIREYKLSVDGYELQFATNFLGHFALTARLFNKLKHSDAARIVMVSSMMHRTAQFNVNELSMPEATYECFQEYSRTKLYLILFMYELNRRLREKNITNVIAVAAHPGIASTNITAVDVSDYDPSFRFTVWAAYKMMHTPEKGALPTLFAAAAPGVQGSDFYGPNGLLEIYGHPQHCEPSQAALSEEDADLLWAKSEGLAKVIFDV